MHSAAQRAIRIGALVCSSLLAAHVTFAQDAERKHYYPPEKISVLPILHVPKDSPEPDPELAKNIFRHVEWAQRRYSELLGTTFQIARKETLVFKGRYTLDQYRAFDNKIGTHLHAQYFDHLNVNRFNCPYVLFSVLYNTKDAFPHGRGGPMNGGFNTGGGTVLMSSNAFTDRPNAQSTFQHELGHAFGLPHVDAYGYKLRGDSPSIMAYNPKHHTDYFKPSATPGIFIPEDLRGLSLNDIALPNFEFDPDVHLPPDYKIKGRVQTHSAGRYQGVTDYHIDVSTDAGEAFQTEVRRVVIGRIYPSPGPELSFDRHSMWHSETITGEANINLTFPFPVELTKIRIYSGHSGKYHAIKSARVLVSRDGDEYRELGRRKFQGFNDQIDFPNTESQSWRLVLTPGESKKLVIRGTRFYSGGTEIFRPYICLDEP